MTKSGIFVLIGVLLILGIGILVYLQKQASLETVVPAAIDNSESDAATNTAESNDEAGMDGDKGGTPSARGDTIISSHGFTMAEVATHNSAQSCWSAINGNVYDLTSWIPNHPGGPDKILQLCGTDGSAKFNGQHGGSEQQATVLAGFIIGVVKN